MTQAMNLEQTTDEWIAEYTATLGDARARLHEGHASSRPLSDRYEVVGMAGEFAFGSIVGLMPDLALRPNGDSGVDFILRLKFSVDVKTARKAGNLIHEEGKPFADIYVLAEFDDATQRATIVGWAYGTELRRAPVRDFGYGVRNHYIPRQQLRPISELTSRCEPR